MTDYDLTPTSTPEEVRAAWVRALRSGDYKQGRGALRRPVGEEESDARHYCCLGVLCDLAVKAGVAPPWYNNGIPVDGGVWVEYDRLPNRVAIWAGTAPDPILRKGKDGTPETATLVNDVAGLIFPEIADEIERTFPVG